MNKLKPLPLKTLPLLLTLASLCIPVQVNAANATSKNIAGKTIIAQGHVTAATVTTSKTQTSDQRQLKRRSPIFNVDVVKTDINSKTQLRMIDGGMIALKANSELLISNYAFDAKQQQGSVVMELLKGGLRSVTGAIKANKGTYQLTTPLGTIGVRGTHYELELLDDSLYLAVWDGAIDVSLNVKGQAKELSLGDNEKYAYASINAFGDITFMLHPPANFRHGHSSHPNRPAPGGRRPGLGGKGPGPGNGPGTPPSGAGGLGGPPPGAPPLAMKIGAAARAIKPQASAEPEQGQGAALAAQIGSTVQTGQFEAVPEDLKAFVPNGNLTELILAKTGKVVYDTVSDLRVGGSAKQPITNFQASMTVNFDHAIVTNGHLSFDDND
ncbi:MAG: hypothetical protein ACI8WB_000449, partial [Phenylobacterium sp.]